MTLIVIDNNKIKKYFATFFISLLSTHLLFYAVLNVGVKLLNGNVYYALYDLDFPITAILLAVFLYFKILLKYFCKVKRKSKIENFIYDCTLYYKDKKINCIGFLDTGNSLYDGNMNLPIIVAPIKAVEKFLSQYELICIMLKKQCETVTNLTYINYATAGTKNSVMPVFKLDKIIVKQETKKMQYECMLGISFTNFKSANYDVLLNEKMLNK